MSNEIEIEIDDSAANFVSGEVEPLLHQAAITTLQHEAARLHSLSLHAISLTLLLTGDDLLQQLNRDFLDLDQPTDVLSFPDGDPTPEGGAYLGDIAISVERAQQQATAAGHDLLDELQLLTVHGVLHLLGHDHAEKDEKQRMWTAQAAVLTELGLDRTLTDTDEHRSGKEKNQ